MKWLSIQLREKARAPSSSHLHTTLCVGVCAYTQFMTSEDYAVGLEGGLLLRSLSKPYMIRYLHLPNAPEDLETHTWFWAKSGERRI